MANTTAPGAFLPWPAFNFGDVKQQAKTAAAEVKRLQAEILEAAQAGAQQGPALARRAQDVNRVKTTQRQTVRSVAAPQQGPKPPPPDNRRAPSDLVRRLEEAQRLKKLADDAVKDRAEVKKSYKEFKLLKGLYTASALKSASDGDIEDAAIMFLSEKLTDPKFLKRVSRAGKTFGFKDLGSTLGDVLPYVGLGTTIYGSIEKTVKAVKGDEKNRVNVMEQARKGYISQAERQLWQTTFEKYIGGGGDAANAMLEQLQTTAEKLFASDKMTSWMGQRASHAMKQAVADRQQELGRTLTDAERKRVLHEAYAKMVGSDDWLAASVVDNGGTMTTQQRAEALEREADDVAVRSAPQAPAMKTAATQYEEQRKAFLETWFWGSRRTSTQDLSRGAAERAEQSRQADAITASKTEGLLNDGSFSALATRAREYVFGGLRPLLADKY